jgi:hypothetical protein
MKNVSLYVMLQGTQCGKSDQTLKGWEDVGTPLEALVNTHNRTVATFQTQSSIFTVSQNGRHCLKL